jgi:hypothetical protein
MNDHNRRVAATRCPRIARPLVSAKQPFENTNPPRPPHLVTAGFRHALTTLLPRRVSRWPRAKPCHRGGTVFLAGHCRSEELWLLRLGDGRFDRGKQFMHGGCRGAYGSALRNGCQPAAEASFAAGTIDHRPLLSLSRPARRWLCNALPRWFGRTRLSNCFARYSRTCSANTSFPSVLTARKAASPNGRVAFALAFRRLAHMSRLLRVCPIS